MEIDSEFAATYACLSDNELLRLWADRHSLVQEAIPALEAEIQRRGLKKQNAARVKTRLDVLEEREKKGPLARQIATAKYERAMTHFVGWEEPEFYSPYTGRDIRNSFAYLRHKYRVWKSFRDHTVHWPAFSICFHFISWMAVFGAAVVVAVWLSDHKRAGGWSDVLMALALFLLLVGVRDLGARLMRKLDWKLYGTR